MPASSVTEDVASEQRRGFLTYLRKVPTIAWVLLGFALVYFMGNWGLAITDPVESNYALSAKGMLKAHDWMSPQIYDHYWYDKPIFFYWEVMLGFQLFGMNEFGAHFFPALVSLLNLVMTYFFAKKVWGQRVALVATVILGSTLEFFVISKAVITDASLFLFMNGVLACFYLAYNSQHKSWYYPMYVLAGLATLVKGPIGFLLPGFIIVLFLLSQRNWREVGRMKLFLGIPLFLVVGGTWYYYMYLVHGMDFVLNFLGVHNFLRATVSEHPNSDVWYYYLLIFILGCLPWTFFLPKQLKKLWRERHHLGLKQKPAEVFLLIWALAIIGFFQCMATKYNTYTYPSLLPIAILFALFLDTRWTLVKRIALGAGFVYIVASLVAIPYTQQKFSGKAMASYIATHLDHQDTLLSQGRYRASTVFYSSHRAYEVIENGTMADMEPGTLSWNAKNVMPLLEKKDIPQTGRVFVVVENNANLDLPGHWEPVYSTSGSRLYELKR